MSDYIDRIRRLHCDRVDGRPRPHKAVMLLSVSILVESGELLDNKIVFNSRLLDVFRSIFDVVRRESDQPTPYNPFFYLKSEGFWHLHPRPGFELGFKHVRQIRSPGQLKELIEYASLDPELFLLFQDQAHRHELQAVLVQAYLSHASALVWQVLKEEVQITTRQQLLLSSQPAPRDKVIERVRSTAFRRMIRDLYDVRCAACGIRFFFDNVDLIDASHLVPFSESGDDSPQNGIALCKNHHWLMDHAILAPGPGRGGNYKSPVWHVREGLDDRLEEHRAVLELKGRSLIGPVDRKYTPAREGLDLRMDSLRKEAKSVALDYAE